VFRTCLDASYAGQLWNGVMVMDRIEAFESDLRNKSHLLRCGVTRDRHLTGWPTAAGLLLVDCQRDLYISHEITKARKQTKFSCFRVFVADRLLYK